MAKPIGRPSAYSDELAALICERIAEGESLRGICRDEDMPSRSMVFRWLAENVIFRDQYTRAREAQADALVEECLEIADDSTNDYMEKQTKGGTVTVVDYDHIARSKLRVDVRKWWAARIAPKKYADRPEPETDETQTVVIRGGLPDDG